MIPNKFLSVPAGYTLFDIEITVRKKNYSSVVDQTDKKTKLLFGCQ
jgi:hypothetical protein